MRNEVINDSNQRIDINPFARVNNSTNVTFNLEVVPVCNFEVLDKLIGEVHEVLYSVAFIPRRSNASENGVHNHFE